MQSKAATVAEYLASLPEDRRAALQAVREVILQNLGEGYEEGMQYGAIGYYVPHSVYPAGYHCDPKQPLSFVGLGSQKNYMSLGLMGCYMSPDTNRWLRSEWAKTGKKLDMGKVCIRFRKLDDLPLELIGEAIRRMPVKGYIAHYESAIRTMNKRASAKATSANTSKKTAKKTVVKKKADKTGKPARKKPGGRRIVKKKAARA